MIHIPRIISALALALVIVACGGDPSNYRLPVDSELRPYRAPEPGEAGSSADDAWDIDFDEEQPADDADATDPAADPAPEAEAVPEEAAPPASPTPISPDKKTPTKPAKSR